MIRIILCYSALLPAVLFFTACGAADRPATAVGTYENPSHGFSLEYPDSFDLRVYGPSFAAIGREGVVSTSRSYEAVFVRAPVVLAPDEVDSALIRRIALSLRVGEATD